MARRFAAVLYAWFGGLAFAASLAYFAYFYFVELGRLAAAGRTGPSNAQAILWNLALFGVFATHHSLMARAGAKRWILRWLPATLERSTYVWIASALFFITCFWWRAIPGELYSSQGSLLWIGRGIQGVGLGLIAKSTAALDVLELAGVRQVSRWETPAEVPRPQAVQGPTGPSVAQELQVAGVYRLVRHPLYLGWVLVVFAAPHMTAGRFAFACISTAYLLVAIPWEERAMVDAFGDEYRQYSERVRWRLIPGVY